MTAKDLSVEEKLRQMFNLQAIDKKIDEIEILKGELPMEVKDLEDEIAGLEKRVANLQSILKFQDIRVISRILKPCNRNIRSS